MSNTTNSAPPPFTDNPIVLDIWTSYGGILIGLVLSSTLYGISGLQTFIYSLHCDADHVMLKTLIGILWMADTANQVLLVVGSWPVLIKQYGRIAGLSAIQEPILHHLWVSHIVIVVVQVFFARRVYIYGQVNSSKSIVKLINTAFAALIGCMILFELCSIVVYLSKGVGKPLAALSSPLELGIGTAFRTVALAIDVFIACGMVFHMSRTSTHFRKSKKLIQRLLVVSVGSGTLTAVCAAILVALLNIYPDDLIYTIVEFPLCSLYFSTLLVNLNSRDYVRSGSINARPIIGSTVDSGTLVIRRMNNSSHTQKSELFVQVENETNIKMDELSSLKGGAKQV